MKWPNLLAKRWLLSFCVRRLLNVKAFVCKSINVWGCKGVNLALSIALPWINWKRRYRFSVVKALQSIDLSSCGSWFHGLMINWPVQLLCVLVSSVPINLFSHKLNDSLVILLRVFPILLSNKVLFAFLFDYDLKNLIFWQPHLVSLTLEIVVDFLLYQSAEMSRRLFPFILRHCK